MEYREQAVEAVVKAVTSGKASTSTSITLRTLLNPEPKDGEARPTSVNIKTRPSKTRPNPTDGTRISARTASKDAFNVHEDGSTALSAKAKQALATNVVNAGLKFLSQAVRVHIEAGQRVKTNPLNETPRKAAASSRPPQCSPARHGALQLRSGNSTPTPASRSQSTASSSLKSSSASPGPSSDGTSGRCAQTVAVAECTSHAFHYLLSTDALGDNASVSKSAQLDKGMLAFCNKLVDLRCDQLAMREFRTIKRRLESRTMPAKGQNTAEVSVEVSATGSSEESTLSSLLDISLDDCADLDTLSLSTAYQVSVLRCIAIQRKPAILTSALRYLKVSNLGGPVNMIQRYAALSGDVTKASQQLDVLSQLILSLCPSTSASKDEIASDPTRHPPPHFILRLQSIALQIQSVSARLTDGQRSSSHSVTSLFSKFLNVCLRRSRSSSEDKEAYQNVAAAYGELHSSGAGVLTAGDDGMALYKIHRNLCLLAENANLNDEAIHWAEELIKSGENLEENHALRSAAKARRLTVLLRKSQDERGSKDINDEVVGMRLSLEVPLKGVTSDLEILLVELSHLIDYLMRESKSEKAISSECELFGVAAGLVARYNRLHPGIGGKHAVSILDAAVSVCRSTEELASWMTRDAIQVMTHSGSVCEISAPASYSTMSLTWSSSRSALVISRMLKGLMYKSARSEPDTSTRFIFDDDHLPLEQRGTLLEWQFMQALPYFRKRQYQSSGQRLLSELLRRLDDCYGSNDHPLRRARVAIHVLRKAQEDSEILPPSTLAPWRECQLVDRDNLKKDHGLSQFVTDVNLSLRVAKAFVDGQPEPTSLSPLFESWLSLMQIPDDGDVAQIINDPTDLVAQLKGLDDYLAMLGRHEERLPLAQVLLHISSISREHSVERSETMLTLIRTYLQIGNTGNARQSLLLIEDDLNSGKLSKIQSLQYEVCRSEYFFAVDDAESCREAIEKAQNVCQAIQQDPSTSASKRFRLLVSQITLIESKLQLMLGSSYDALKMAKEVSKHLNAIWLSLEKSDKHDKHEPEELEFGDEEKEIQGLTKGISKLNLKAKSGIEDNGGLESDVKGVTFWPLIPILCEAFSHLSAVLAHHGIFRDAMYCSNQAVKVAGTQRYSRLSAHMLICRGVLNTTAGKLEAAELDLATAAEMFPSECSLTGVHFIRAQAGLRSKEGHAGEASKLYHKAEHMLQRIQSEICLPRPDPSDTCKDNRTSEDQKTKGRTNRSALPSKEPVRSTTAKARTSRSTSKRSPAMTSTVVKNSDSPGSCSYLFHKLEAHILLDKTLATFKMGGPVAAHIIQLQDLFSSLPGTSSQRQVEFHGMMRKVAVTLQQDVSFNVLPESTLAVPALIRPATETSTKRSTASRPQKKPTKMVAASSRKAKSIPVETLESLLLDAAGCLMVKDSCIRTTAETHLELAMVSSAAMLLSATCLTSASNLDLPVRSALSIELPRIIATECRSASAKVEMELHGHKRLKERTPVNQPRTHPNMTAAEFQEQYIDILPKPWTAVSLSLSEDAEELYISRYRQGSSPLILRLPFARHKPDGEDDEPFDFNTGKAELQDIIELNNYTCHQPVDTKNKTARDKWWTEREALDRRLEELLINMENIWLGGFKGIFSQQQVDPSLLEQFRTAFESTLERHLPSRNCAKRNSDRLVISDAILELFIGLGVNDEGEMDLDEALADLLYFVVDMLQFNGERNAYDEVDFDTMSVEVFDALDAYHRGVEEGDSTGKHTILVLDRRLQAFPWESLPVLNETSVSRVDSMLTLRERVLEMQDQYRQNCSDRRSVQGVYSIPRNSGSYIINPSGDLKHTEESLEPTLSTLKDSQDSRWSSIVKRGPTEDEFKAVLDTSSTLLYFGHGAATQYIRPRAIRQLERCSEVVWLMGCSSGSITEHDELEPSAVPYEYLVAGQAREPTSQHDGPHVPGRPGPRRCMAVLAMLWDVTDKDIDRFSLAVGDEWGLWISSPGQSKLPAKTPRKREVAEIPSTPRQVPKTPKTPRVRNTPAPTRTPARSRSRTGRDRKLRNSLVDAVARSRNVCYLRYLNGAAPVVYGIPVYLED